MPKLHLIPTPIGNLQDITFRAVKVLQEADLILVEDPRHTGKLLKHYKINQKMVPYHQHNEPTALIPALVNSGFPCEHFCFEGFLPHKKGRQKRLNQLLEESRTMIFYESPHRLIKTLTQLKELLGGDRMVAVSRELTKIHEETIRGTLIEAIDYFSQKPVKGEIVIVLQGKPK